jgi:fused signal recognition particle receptor
MEPWIALGAAGLLVVALGVWLLWRSRRRRPSAALPPGTAARPASGERLRRALSATRQRLGAQIDAALGREPRPLNVVLQDLEEVLLSSDVGVGTTTTLLDAIRQRVATDAPAAAVRSALEQEIRSAVASPLPPEPSARPWVILVTGVNGVGKTTTIGKLAAKLTADGKKVILAAGDTFRAAATEQLEIWGQRTGTPVVKGKEGGDPSAVLFDAVKRAQAEGYDVVICDTAGRLHTKDNLMAELEKVRRVMKKALPDAPHETFLVLDATNGQNAIAQAATFKQAMDITGIVLTKLDGTAKGGVILGICDELQVPVRFIGIGEKVADLRPFDAHEFVSALYETDAR